MTRTFGYSLATTLVLGAAAFGGCANEATPAPDKGFNITVAPLSLPGIKDVCYTLEVRNDQGQTVWTQEHVCSTQYGNSAGDVSYVGTCDADDSDDNGDAKNTVTLTIENIYTDAVDPNDYATNAVADSEWVNPCGTDADSVAISPNGDGFGPCQIVEPCVENQDTFIEFNVTVMRNAQQGFFDIAVNFEDIFCSAKLDCRTDSDESGVVDTADDYIQLLHDASGRSDTVVMGFACTAGPGQDTHLYWTDVTVTCGGTDYVVDPSGGPGNLNIDNAALFQAATYRGAEQLETDLGVSLAKRYWNVALGLKAAGQAADCTLSAKASAHDGALTDGITPEGTTYPYIEFAANLSTCTQHKMGSDQVKEKYTGLSTPETFAWFSNATEVGPTVVVSGAAVGERCFLPEDCASGICGGFNNWYMTFNRACMSAVEIGSICYSDSDCSSIADAFCLGATNASGAANPFGACAQVATPRPNGSPCMVRDDCTANWCSNNVYGTHDYDGIDPWMGQCGFGGD